MIHEEKNSLSQHADITAKYLKEIGYKQLMSEGEEKECALLVTKGCKKAFHNMIERNLRLVIKVARTYRPKGAMSFLDVISEGNLGLIRAVEKFNPDMGYRFSTYAVWWIRDMIEKSLMNQNRTIRIPIPKLKELNIYNRAFNELKNQLNKNPTTEEVANRIGRPVTEVKKLLCETRDSEYFCEIDYDNEFINQYGNDISSSPEEIYSKQQTCKVIINNFMDPLNDQQRKVIMMRYGLNGYKEHKLDECLYEFKVSRERIRQIHSISLEKLKETRKECYF
jgi:RNA polymerase nonessential primary-like sigma factor